VFPYSARPGTPAASMPCQLSSGEKERRARELIALGRKTALKYLSSWVGLESMLIPEEMISGCWEGYTPEYIRVRLREIDHCRPGEPVRIRLTEADPRFMRGEIIETNNMKG